MSRRNSRERDVERMNRAQLLSIVRDPLAPAKIAWRAYNRLEGMST
jgi:hypothetical protein